MTDHVRVLQIRIDVWVEDELGLLWGLRGISDLEARGVGDGRTQGPGQWPSSCRSDSSKEHLDASAIGS